MKFQATMPSDDLVQVTLTGRIVDRDEEKGYVYLRGTAPGQEHIEWTYTLHWATKFTPVGDALDSTADTAEREREVAAQALRDAADYLAGHAGLAAAYTLRARADALAASRDEEAHNLANGDPHYGDDEGV